MSGKFITLEGIDGSGKSTQMRLLAAELRTRRGIDPIETCQPGGTALGQRLRRAFLETEETVAPMAELLLFAADRAQHVELLIRPSLAAGRVVISDRYADATAAYQGAGRGFAAPLIDQIIKLATGGLQPDLTLFFDIPVGTAVARMRERSHSEATPNRMDFENVDFYERVRAAYLEIARRDPQRFCVIDGDRTVDDVHRSAAAIVMSFLDRQ